MVRYEQNALARDRTTYRRILTAGLRTSNRLQTCPGRQRGLTNLPDNIELLFQMGRVFFVQARYSKARKTLRSCVVYIAERAEARELLAQIHLNNRDEQQALAVLRQGWNMALMAVLLQARLGLTVCGRACGRSGRNTCRMLCEPIPTATRYAITQQALLRAGKEAEGRQLLDYFSLLQREHQNILDFKTAIVLNPNDAGCLLSLGSYLCQDRALPRGTSGV